jgi:L-asparaginase/Glu-tRNA(Gln) amidotransferase subunit D
MEAKTKLRVAHLSGPNATIQNTPPLVTSNKARQKYGLGLLKQPDGSVARFDALRTQRLAAPAKVYVEQFSAHPLERDAAELYGPPDGYLDGDGVFHQERRGAADKPVYEIELRPEDGLYPLPYMARQVDGNPWEEECAVPNAPQAQARQGFFPDGSRSFEEIDRLSIGPEGAASPISSLATVDFYRLLPPSGYTKGLPAELRTDVGEGDIPPETRGKDFFPYKPRHLAAGPPRPALARVTNMAQHVMSSGKYDGAILTQGSPAVEETSYWLNLLIDTPLPICGNAAQRPQGQISNDGPKNIVDSLTYIGSRIWADEHGRNRAGVVVIQEQRAFAAREVAKADARPGGYVATGGHGGILGGVNHVGKPVLLYVPAYKHTYLSDVNTTRLPDSVQAVRISSNRFDRFQVAIKGPTGDLLADAIPSVSIVKEGGYFTEEFGDDPSLEHDLIFLIQHKLGLGRLAGFVTEGQVPYGSLPSQSRQKAMEKAVLSGLPVVRVGRGNPEGFADSTALFIAGSNLTATKARLLLMACLMKFGSLPAVADPDNPTSQELKAVETATQAYQSVFDTH